MNPDRRNAALIAALYLGAIIIAVTGYVTHHVLTYGIASWSGGVLFVVGVQAWGRYRATS